MAALLSIVAADLTHAVATFDAAMDPASLLPHLWSVVPTGPGAQAAIVKTTVAVGGITADLLFSPNLSAGQQYTGTANDAKLADGTPLAGNAKSANFTVPQQAANPTQPGFPHGLRESALEAIAAEMQYLSGRPTTMLVAEYPDGATTLLVESTLGFPSAGRFWVGDRRYNYAAKTPASFLGVAAEFPTNGQTLYPKALLYLDLGSVGVLP